MTQVARGDRFPDTPADDAGGQPSWPRRLLAVGHRRDWCEGAPADPAHHRGSCCRLGPCSEASALVQAGQLEKRLASFRHDALWRAGGAAAAMGHVGGCAVAHSSSGGRVTAGALHLQRSTPRRRRCTPRTRSSPGRTVCLGRPKAAVAVRRPCLSPDHR